MASMVYQGLQSCLDHQSRLVESSWTLRLRLSSPKLIPPPPPLLSSPKSPIEIAFKSSSFLDSTPTTTDNKELIHPDHNSINGSTWSFLQSLSTTSKPVPIKETPLIDQHHKQEAVYVHPLAKRSISTLSEKSLKLCTENLGNETGADDYTTETGVFSSLLSNSTALLSSGASTTTRKQLAVVSAAGQHMAGTKKTTTKGNNNIRQKSYPPPLTTIRGSESIRVRPHREDGRLIIKAEKVQDGSESCFQAERSQGRLRLCVLKNVNVDSAQGKEEVEIENNDGEDQGQDFGEERNVGEVDVNRESYGGENGREKLTERPCSSSCRCKEADGKEKGIMVLNNWEPFWVAT